MNSLAIKRITRDVMNIKKDPMDDNGIFIYWDEEAINKVKALIIGPEDTPYQYGNYLFDITFPDEYPHKPPKVKYQTREGNIRFNPNLYTCGKVCVSILNTWSGPQWTSCQSLRSVLLSLQTLLNSNPIQNEPGFENEKGEKSIKYIDVLTYSNFNVAILKLLQDPGNFEMFLPQMREQFIKNYEKIMIKLEKFKNKKDEKLHSPIYNITINSSYKKLNKDIKELYNNFTYDTKVSQLENVNLQKEFKEIINSKNVTIRKKKKSPNENAENYEIGYITVSTNDNKKYIVYEDKNKNKKWKKYVEIEIEI